MQAAEERWQQHEAQLRGEVTLLESSVRRLEGSNADLQAASSEHLQPLQRCAWVAWLFITPLADSVCWPPLS